MSEVDVLYKCLVCGRAFDNVQSLRAHFKAHRGKGYVRTSILIPGDAWETFKALCKEHNTTTCHALSSLIEMWNKGVKEGVVTLGSPNPVVIQMTQIFMGQPRSKFKVPLPVPWYGKIPVCESAYRVHAQNGTIACSRWGRGVSAAECGRCPWLRGWTEVS